jgi:DNA-binding NarL/FixJ family response regulator
MTLNCIVVDDEPSNLAQIIKYAKNNAEINLIFSTTNPIEAQKYIENNPVDLLITDIDMPELSGIELNERIKNRSKTIFITGYISLALEAMRKNVIETLTKPFSQEAFNLAIEKAIKIINFDKNQEANNLLLADYKLLSEAEKYILLEIGKKKGNKQIADDNNTSISTIESHKANIKAKLGLKTSNDLLIFAHELLKIILLPKK